MRMNQSIKSLNERYCRVRRAKVQCTIVKQESMKEGREVKYLSSLLSPNQLARATIKKGPKHIHACKKRYYLWCKY